MGTAQSRRLVVRELPAPKSVAPGAPATHIARRCVGVADSQSWQVGKAAVAMMKAAQVEGVKLNADGGNNSITQDVINRVRDANRDMWLMVRVFGKCFQPEQYIRDRLPALTVAYTNGVNVFELLNELNHPAEGLGQTHHNAQEAAALWSRAAVELRRHFPDARVLLPAVSPGVAGHEAFEAAFVAALSAPYDGVCVHAYGTPQDIVERVRTQAARFAATPVYVTEFSRPWGDDMLAKAVEAAQVYETPVPVNVKAWVSFVIAETGGWPREQWTLPFAQEVGAQQ